jgi:hypothetical protein
MILSGLSVASQTGTSPEGLYYKYQQGPLNSYFASKMERARTSEMLGMKHTSHMLPSPRNSIYAYNGNQCLNSIKGWKFIDQFSDNQDSASRSSFIQRQKKKGLLKTRYVAIDL